MNKYGAEIGFDCMNEIRSSTRRKMLTYDKKCIIKLNAKSTMLTYMENILETGVDCVKPAKQLSLAA